MYNEGISREGGLLDVGIAAGVLSKTGAWFNYGDTRLGQGRENARDFLKSNPEIAAKVEQEIRGKVSSIEVGVEGISRGRVARRRCRRRAAGRRRPASPRTARRRWRSPPAILATRPRTRWEVQRRLQRAGADDGVVTATLERLAASGTWTTGPLSAGGLEQRDRHAPRGRRLIEAELRQRGIGREAIEALRESWERPERTPDAQALPATDLERACSRARSPPARAPGAG